eukprot:TRINITY_DN38896_c0_g1_i1.p1 TRINITY_DN38896_c0_g1~~TRINITY_DN38896_c0_g1_i1.p1  ORF type:complete len:473 (+),score=84.76 TRINITY_DN38896_c0_g1_i1:208-1419(+)
MGSALFYVYNGNRVSAAPELDPEEAVRYYSEPTASQSQGKVWLTAAGRVLGLGGNEDGQLGVGDQVDREGVTAARLPWAAAAVRAVGGFRVALRRGGSALCTWGKILGRGGDRAIPAEVLGLPADDPVVLLEVGGVIQGGHVLFVTASGEVYGWGSNSNGQLALGPTARAARPMRIAALSGRGLQRLACCHNDTLSVAETADGQLLCFGVFDLMLDTALPPRPLPVHALAFPLRSLAVDYPTIAAADALGKIWRTEIPRGLEEGFCPVPLPAPERAVCVAVCFITPSQCGTVALTASGRLWDYPEDGPCRSIHEANPGLPLGLLPRGSERTSQWFLMPNLCGGKERLSLFARIAVRLGLPSDPVRAVLTGLAVHEAFITGPNHEPFSWPDLSAGSEEESSESE